LPVHDHGWHQIVFAAAGVLAVEDDETRWLVPPGRAVWVPAGTRHRLVARTAAELRTIYIAPSFAPLRDAVATFAVTALLRELVLHVVSIGMLDRHDAAHGRLARVLLDQLLEVDEYSFTMVEPRDPLARAASELLADDPTVPLRDVARRVGCSLRTLERRFPNVGTYRQQVRIARAIELLAGGASVTATAAEVGYATTSAFVVAFRKLLAETPARYVRLG
jgi:AraC-like DNA-binding protein